jgi:23S rRNA A2030 N6-methylase RlmJ
MAQWHCARPGGSAPTDVAALLAPYLYTISACHPGHESEDGIVLCYHPGSPLIALHLMRRQDRLIAREIEPSTADLLLRTIGSDPRAKVIAIDGYVALNAYVPPKERRGLVLVDPPFERSDEFASLLHAVVKAWRKWPTGIYMLWYPLEDRRRVAAFSRELASIVGRKVLRVELDSAAGEDGLAAAGLFIINPPWRLADEFKDFTRLACASSGAGAQLRSPARLGLLRKIIENYSGQLCRTIRPFVAERRCVNVLMGLWRFVVAKSRREERGR